MYTKTSARTQESHVFFRIFLTLEVSLTDQCQY